MQTLAWTSAYKCELHCILSVVADAYMACTPMLTWHGTNPYLARGQGMHGVTNAYMTWNCILVGRCSMVGMWSHLTIANDQGRLLRGIYMCQRIPDGLQRLLAQHASGNQGCHCTVICSDNSGLPVTAAPNM